ncbi:CLIP domain-containing serine protease [Halocaridina rubra]|uniref:CLIP domain-containing serine protease n=1 Tax=Halocaridina rubra TaxID=373956 RepID=A0AAN8ZYX7_HALRR
MLPFSLVYLGLFSLKVTLFLTVIIGAVHANYKPCLDYQKCVPKIQCKWKGWELEPAYICSNTDPTAICCPINQIISFAQGQAGHTGPVYDPYRYNPYAQGNLHNPYSHSNIKDPYSQSPKYDPYIQTHKVDPYAQNYRYDPYTQSHGYDPNAHNKYGGLGDRYNTHDVYGPPEKHGYVRYDPYYMDFYSDQYEKYYGYTLSKQAKEILRNYRAREECGVRNQSPADMARISSGFLPDYGFTSFGEFRWHVALLLLQRSFRRESPIYKYHCGATLIHNSLLITAAHCVRGVHPKKLLAHLGDWNLQDSAGELFPAIKRRISRVFIHNQYNPSTYLNDIALLEMRDPIDTYKTPHIGPVCLPKANYRLKDQSKCYIVGWGDDLYKPNFGSNILKSVSVTYISDNQECSSIFYSSLRDVDIGDKFTLDKDAQKCIVGGYGRDACVGDGGGGVVCPLSNSEGPDVCNTPHCADEHYFLIGIISFGSTTCGDESITIITDVVQNLNWIYTVLDPAGGLKNYNNHYYDEKPYGGRSADIGIPVQKNVTNV